VNNILKTSLYKSALTAKVVSVLVLDVNEVDDDFYLVTVDQNGENAEDGGLTDELTNSQWLDFAKNNNLTFQRPLNENESKFSNGVAFF